MNPASSHSAYSAQLSPLASGVRFDGDRLLIQLADGREISGPVAWFPRPVRATPEQPAQQATLLRGLKLLSVEMKIACLMSKLEQTLTCHVARD